jgi:predicted Zn-dependent protease
VLGTIGGREGGVAVIAAQGEPPRVVAVGEEVMGYSLASVGEGRVVVTRDGRDVSVMMEDANASVVAAAGNRRGQQTRAASRAGGGRAQESSETTFFDAARLQMQVGERVREALERLEQRRQPEGNQGRTNGQRGQATQRSSPRPPGGG